MRILVSIVCVCVLLGFVHIAAPIVIPLLLALALATAFQPIAHRISRRGLPPVVAAVVSILLVLVVVAAAGAIVYIAATDLAAGLPEYAKRLQAFQAQLAGWLDDRSMSSAAASVRAFDIEGPLASGAQTLVLGLGGYLQTLFFVLVITAFIQLEARHYRRKLIKTFEGPAPVRSIMTGLHEVQRYMLVKVALSAANGIFLGLWCWAWGVDSPLMWGVLAFALNFIPVIGSIIAAAPPIGIALLTAGVGNAIGVSVGYILVNLVVDNILEPRVMGKAVDLSPLIVLLAMFIWGFVLGPVGALLSVPITVAVRIYLDNHPETRWIGLLLAASTKGYGDKPKSRGEAKAKAEDKVHAKADAGGA